MNSKNVAKLRKVADGLTPKIETLSGKSLGDRAWTRKRSEEIEYAHKEAARLEKIRGKLLTLAGMMETDSEPQWLTGLNTFACAEVLDWLSKYPANDEQRERLMRNGINFGNFDQAKAAWNELVYQKNGASAAAALDTKIRGLAGKIEGFWPTPRELVDLLIEMARTEMAAPPKRILEPSAGTGNIAFVLVEEFPNAEIVAVERAYSLHEVMVERLALLGHSISRISLARMDFEEFDRGKFDLVVMNPPFEKMADIDHVMRAYRMLNPGGVLVSIMSPSWTYNSVKKATDFRVNFDELAEEGRAAWLPLEEQWFKKMGTGTKVGILTLLK